MFRFTYTLPTGWAQFASRSPLWGHFTTNFYSLATAFWLLLLPQFVTGQCTTLICAQNVQFSLGNDCTGSVNPVNMLTNYWSCQGPLTLNYFDAGNNPLGTTLTSAQLGQTVNVHVKHNWTNLTCWGSVYVKDGKKPTITTANLTLNCTEDTSATALDPPSVTDNCSPVGNITLSHQDTVIDFGCGYTGFAGYFDPSNWNICLTSNGDGGVDVTGAPNSVLVEGANSSPISNTSSYVTRFKIVIPTEGYVSFDWSSFGGSSFSNEGFYLTINNWCIRLSNDTTQAGTYTTGLLHPGDVLSFEQTSNGSSNANSTIVSNFHFSTLAWRVIQRKWTATDEWGNTATKVQTITLNRTQLSQVHFPPNRDGVQAPMLPCGSNATDPSVTGSPFIDEDGNLATATDQYAVDNGDCFFNLAHTDQVIPTCGGSVLILRKWTVIDDCTGQFAEHTQLIKLFDITPPTITCPPSATVSTDDFGCFGIINLPSANAVDDCSAPITITPTWSFGSGFGPFGNVPQGTHTVTYEASDACGNTSNCTTTITVEDQIAPTVICQQFTVASIASTGEATVYANLLDAGSYDHCCIESYEVKRANQPNSAYAPSLVVSCADLPVSSVVVTLRVMDCHGNSNSCDVTVNVHDELPPVVVPPNDVVVDCNTDLSNLSLFGQAAVMDNCSFILNETVTPSISSCGDGIVTRVFTATDPSGNVTSAQQVIHLVNQTPWNSAGNQIIWPFNYQSQACSGESLEPFDLPYPYNGPTLLGQNGCENVAVNYEDEIFWIAEPACYKIERTWTILDWCQYQANSGSNLGMWTHIQLIEVADNQAPIFVNPPANIMASSGAGCSGNVNLPLPQVSDCSNHVTITASGSLGSGYSFQNVPAGVYPMIFTASDGCGNSSQHSFTVSVGDTGAPTAYCVSGVNVELNAQGEASLAALQLNFNSFDNCAPASSLQFSFSQNVANNTQLFTCGDVGPNLVQLWVTDPGGNSDFCETIVTVQDNLSACGANIDLGGMIQTPAGAPVGQVMVDISGALMPTVTTQAGVGSYAFSGLPAGGDFTITPTKDIGQSNGVTAFDLAKINEHILAVTPFTQAWQVIAADANNSGSVTASDLVAIQAVILNAAPGFQNGTPSWRFVPASHVFGNPANPWPFSQELSLNDVVQDNLSAGFIGIKTGDVSGNADPAFVVGSSAVVSLQSACRGGAKYWHFQH
ncbi:MAG: HYR domain-containing protein [Saprospiraceae bacterium]|nr:HYR domain-containing protein [Saprospiraceae bacterium]